MAVFGVFLSIFSRIWTEYGKILRLSVFNPNAEKCGPEKITNTDTFHVVTARAYSRAGRRKNNFFRKSKTRQTKDRTARKITKNKEIFCYSLYLLDTMFSSVIERGK